jgi:hypothetical protein
MKRIVLKIVIFKNCSSQALVAYVYNPSYSGGRDQEDPVGGQPGHIVCETLSQK